MPRDKEKERARRKAYRERERIKKYGPQCIGKSMRGKHGNHVRGSKHYRWNDDRMICDHGYAKIRVGVTHPMADPNGYAYEHHVVWASSGRSMPSAGYEIHHIDECKTNNRIENLTIISCSEHGALHTLKRRQASGNGRLQIESARDRASDQLWACKQMPEVK